MQVLVGIIFKAYEGNEEQKYYNIAADYHFEWRTAAYATFASIRNNNIHATKSCLFL